MSPFAAKCIDAIRLNVRNRSTRKELRTLMNIRHGQPIPNDVNLRNYVSEYHAHQQAINGGAAPSPFWISASYR